MNGFALSGSHSLRSSVTQRHNGDAAAALVLWSGFEAGDVGVCREEFGNGLPKSAGPRAVNDADFRHLSKKSVIQEFVSEIERLINPSADEVDFVLLQLFG